MEGGPISVTSSVTFPAQPAVGELFYVPLGGDGYTSPFAAHSLRSMRATGDGSGTFVRLEAVLDPRFVSLVSYATVQVQQGTGADADFRLDISSDETSIVSVGPITAQAVAQGAIQNARTIRPPSTLLPGGSRSSSVSVQFVNVSGDFFFLDLWVYLFNIRVRETTPIAPLLWAQGGAA